MITAPNSGRSPHQRRRTRPTRTPTHSRSRHTQPRQQPRPRRHPSRRRSRNSRRNTRSGYTSSRDRARYRGAPRRAAGHHTGLLTRQTPVNRHQRHLNRGHLRNSRPHPLNAAGPDRRDDRPRPLPTINTRGRTRRRRSPAVGYAGHSLTGIRTRRPRRILSNRIHPVGRTRNPTPRRTPLTPLSPTTRGPRPRRTRTRRR